jgi:hypothetical protein
MNIKGLAAHTVVVGGVCLAIIAPSAAARPITDVPTRSVAPAHSAVAAPAPQVQKMIRDDRNRAVALDQTSSRTTPQAASGGFDWVTGAIGLVALAGVLGLIWLAAAAISRVTRARVVH